MPKAICIASSVAFFGDDKREWHDQQPYSPVSEVGAPSARRAGYRPEPALDIVHGPRSHALKKREGETRDVTVQVLERVLPPPLRELADVRMVSTCNISTAKGDLIRVTACSKYS